ncbi:hypothetical protein [Paraburkholderia sp.]|uniref:hypothetical protein n=1 Tax=Paraburkholderia sp. TaxID=1926495 RepID=UPI003C783A0D
MTNALFEKSASFSGCTDAYDFVGGSSTEPNKNESCTIPAAGSSNADQIIRGAGARLEPKAALLCGSDANEIVIINTRLQVGLWALRKAEQVIRSRRISSRSQELMTLRRLPDINIRHLPTTDDVELPLPILNASDRVFFGDFPSRAVPVHATDMGDCFVPALAVRFINAANLMSCCHYTPYSAENYCARCPRDFSRCRPTAPRLP